MPQENERKLEVIDLIVGLVVLLLCLYIFVTSFSLGPRTRILPVFLVSCMGGIAAFHCLRLMRRLFVVGGMREIGMWDIKADLLAKRNIFPFIAAVIAYLFVLSIEPIGYEISSFLFLLLILFLMEATVTIRKVLIAIIVPAISYVVFAYGLQLRFPLLISKFLE